MMPLVLANQNEELTILKIGGKQEVKQHLEDVGFVVGSKVMIVSSNDGNMIVNIKDSRISLDRNLAMKIMV